MSETREKSITFVDPDTGETYAVKPAKATVAAAWKLGFMPFTSDDMDRAEAVEVDAA